MNLNCNHCLVGNCKDCIVLNCLCGKSHNKTELVKSFTNSMFSLLPQSPQELIQILRDDIDKERTVDSDKQEFSKNSEGGFFAYEKKNAMQYFAKDFVSDIMLPAHVYNGKESCGKWKVKGCLEKHENNGGYISKGVMSCNNRGCRKCATSSIKREAKSITNRLMTFANLKKNRKIYLKENRSRILSHNVVSIPFEEHSLYLKKEGRKKLRAKAIKILKQFDIDGGVMIDHPYRFSKGLESARLSPHLHLILTGWIDGQKVKEIYEKTGWIIANISTIQSWKDCYSLAKYILSHSAVFMKEEGKRSSEHTVRYFGECHNKKFKVEEVLKHSITGYDQLDSIIEKRKRIMKYEVKEIFYHSFKHGFKKKNKPYAVNSIPLQKVSYTHSIIQDNLKDVQNVYFEEFVNGDTHGLSKSLRRFIDVRKDNAPLPQSEPPSMEFLQMRFDYGYSQYDIVQSVYENIIFDADFDCLCPECTMKMETLTLCSSGWSDKQSKEFALALKDLPDGIVFPIDDITQFDYMRNSDMILGMQYFDLDGNFQFDSGVYQKPDCLDFLNPKLSWSIIRDINSQEAKFRFKVQNGRSPTFEELQEFLKIKQFQHHTLEHF